MSKIIEVEVFLLDLGLPIEDETLPMVEIFRRGKPSRAYSQVSSSSLGRLAYACNGLIGSKVVHADGWTFFLPV